MFAGLLGELWAAIVVLLAGFLYRLADALSSVGG